MPDDQQGADQPPMAIPVDEPEDGSWAQRLRAACGPAWAQARRNLRVWIPWLATRRDADCRVCVPSRDNRTGLTWEIALPRQCWFCAATESLESRTFRREVRTFESPLQIAGVALAISAFFLLLTYIWWIMAAISVLALLGGALVLMLKSWPEQVRVVVWSCPEHQSALREPEMVVYDDLTLLVGSESLAQATRDQLKAQRQFRPRSHGGQSAPSAKPSPGNAPAPAAVRPPPVAELPKIKLAGDEDEPGTAQ